MLLALDKEQAADLSVEACCSTAHQVLLMCLITSSNGTSCCHSYGAAASSPGDFSPSHGCGLINQALHHAASHDHSVINRPWWLWLHVPEKNHE